MEIRKYICLIIVSIYSILVYSQTNLQELKSRLFPYNDPSELKVLHDSFYLKE